MAGNITPLEKISLQSDISEQARDNLEREVDALTKVVDKMQFSTSTFFKPQNRTQADTTAYISATENLGCIKKALNESRVVRQETPTPKQDISPADIARFVKG